MNHVHIDISYLIMNVFVKFSLFWNWPIWPSLKKEIIETALSQLDSMEVIFLFRGYIVDYVDLARDL